MKQFLLNRECRRGLSLLLDGEDFHYLCHVRRGKIGQSLCIRDKNGRSYDAALTEVSEKSCTLLIGEEREAGSRACALELYCCLPKGKKFDAIIRQATEAGVRRIVPVFGDHSLVRFDPGEFEKKALRWEKIVKEARQQSGSSEETLLASPLSVAEIPQSSAEEAAFFCHQEFIRRNTLSDLFQKTPEVIKILVGPEGGLSERELAALEEKNFHPLFLGSNVLRAETACLFAISSIITVMELM